MQDRPTAQELLAVARTTLLEEVLPAVPEEKRLAVLIVANVLAMAGRELGFGEALLRHEAAALGALYGEEPPAADAAEALAAWCHAMNRRLAADIRKRAFAGDAAKLAEARAVVVAQTVQKLRESNPRFLDASGIA